MILALPLTACGGADTSTQTANQSQSAATAQTAGEGYAVVTADDVAALPADAILVDTRTADEYAEGHIPGALNASYPNESGGPCAAENNASGFDLNWEALGITDLDAHIVLYCRTGHRAANAAEALLDAGYTDVSLYEGSWEDWTSDPSRPVE